MESLDKAESVRLSKRSWKSSKSTKSSEMFSYFTDEFNHIGCLTKAVQISSLLEELEYAAKKVFIN